MSPSGTDLGGNNYEKTSFHNLSPVIAGSFHLRPAVKRRDPKQIKSLKADKQITLTFDGGTTKIMAIGDNFADSEAKSAGIQAMNFGMAFTYAGKDLAAPPETINFNFWVMSKKPKFADAHAWKATIGTENLDLGDARYRR